MIGFFLFKLSPAPLFVYACVFLLYPSVAIDQRGVERLIMSKMHFKTTPLFGKVTGAWALSDQLPVLWLSSLRSHHLALRYSVVSLHFLALVSPLFPFLFLSFRLSFWYQLLWFVFFVSPLRAFPLSPELSLQGVVESVAFYDLLSHPSYDFF